MGWFGESVGDGLELILGVRDLRCHRVAEHKSE